MSADEPVVWAANWYMTRKHVDVDGRALCSQYTQTWPDGYHTLSHDVPAADSDEVAAMTPCGLCTRKLARAKQTPTTTAGLVTPTPRPAGTKP